MGACCSQKGTPDHPESFGLQNAEGGIIERGGKPERQINSEDLAKKDEMDKQFFEQVPAMKSNKDNVNVF